MKLSSKLVVVTLFLCALHITAQDYKFGKVSEEELAEKYYDRDSSTVASVLFRELSIRYVYIQSSGFKVVTDVHERVKIYKKEGFDYATVSEQLYKSDTGSEKESFKSLKAYTYNLVAGKIEETKLKGSDTFTEEVSKYYNKEKFTLPNVKEGSVIEYTYTLESPFSYSIDEIVLQYDIPIKKQEISIATPEYFVFNPSIKGYLNAIPKISRKSGKITIQSKTRNSGNSGFSTTSTKFSSNSIDYLINIASYSMMDVPALKEEPFVNNMNNYRSAIDYELQYVQFPQQPRKSYSTTWDKVVETIYDSPNFGRQLENTRYFKEELPIILANTATENEKMNAVFFYVQKLMNWNGYYGKYTDQGVKNAFKEKTGNVADINLLLVAMLKEAGLKAYPVLVSTRNNGVPLFPTREGFNYVIASAEINNEIVLLDATNKYAEPDMIPKRALNWFGRLIKEDGSSTAIPLGAKMQSQETNMIQASLQSDGSLDGVMRTIYSDYNAYNYRNVNNEIGEEDYLDNLENKLSGMEISNFSVENKKEEGKAVTEKFEFFIENQADVIGTKIYFSPTLFKTEKENPFKLAERNYPIDFGYPWVDKLMMAIEIPEGFKIESMPEPIALSLPKDMGAFSYNITSAENKISILVTTTMNSSIIGIQDYTSLKEFYRLLVEKETEKVVLSKI
tara:strand:- start:20765 stop:22795 length:2031 start_codon:yes stop_codon:yes gene_type:complete